MKYNKITPNLLCDTSSPLLNNAYSKMFMGMAKDQPKSTNQILARNPKRKCSDQKLPDGCVTNTSKSVNPIT